MCTSRLARQLAALVACAALSPAALPQAELLRMRVFGDPLADDGYYAADIGTNGEVALVGAAWGPQIPTSTVLDVYSPAGVLAWSATMPGATWLAYPYFAAVRIDASGHFWVVWIGDDQIGRPMARLSRYSPSGSLLWTFEYPAAPDESNIAANLVLDDSGNAIVVGYVRPWPSNGPETTDSLTFAVSPQGALAWDTRWSPGADRTHMTSQIDRAPNGDLYIGGYTQFPANTPPRFRFVVAKLSPGGVLQWSTHFCDVPGTDQPIPLGILASNERVVFGTLTLGSWGAASQQTFVFDADGQVAWSLWGGGAVAFDEDASCVIARTIQGSDFQGRDDELALLRIDAAGSVVETQTWSPPPPSWGAGAGAILRGVAGDYLVGARGFVQQYDGDLGLTWSLRLASEPGRRFDVGPMKWISPTRLVAVGNVWLPPASSMPGQDLQHDLFIAHIDVSDAPRGYCEPGVNALGCAQRLTYTGASSASAASGFELRIGEARNHTRAILLYGLDGPLAAPFGAGALCVRPPHARTPLLDAGGNALPADDCSGALAIDWNAFASGALGGSPSPALAIAGTHVWIQAWIADRGSPAGATLSSAFTYAVQP